MKRVDSSYGSLLQGVSQQPPQTRTEGQCSIQENMSSDPVLGLCRRQCTQRQFDFPVTGTGWRFRFLDVSPTHRFILAFKAGELRVFDLFTGAEKTVNLPVDMSYVTDARMALATLQDEVYMCNTSKIPAMLPNTTGTLDTGYGVVQILGGQYSSVYSLIIKFKLSGVDKTVTVSYTTPHASTVEDFAGIQTSKIATELYNALVANADFNTNFTAVKHDAVVGFKRKSTDVTDLQVTGTDSRGNQNITAYSTEVTKVADLARTAYVGHVVKVRGVEVSADDYYVKFTATDTADGEFFSAGTGVWRECPDPTVEYQIDPSTMPHVLTYDAVADEFTFSPGAWDDREVGDDLSNPLPSFIGHTINDIAVFQGRLVFLAGSAVIMSRTNIPTSFWRKTALQETASDTIDFESNVKYGVTMQRAVMHNRDLVIFSDKAQFIIFGRTALTPQNASMVVTVAFDADLNADPVEAGAAVFFAQSFGRYSGIREFYTEAASDAQNSASITTHIKEYILGRAKRLAASSNFDTLIVSTEEDESELYVYQYVVLGTERVQAAWSKWIFRNLVKYNFFAESNWWSVQYNEARAKYEMHVMPLERSDDNGVGYQVHLDSKLKHIGVNTTLLIDEADKRVYVQGTGCPNPGMLAVVESSTPTAVVFSRDMQGGTVYSGFTYMSQWSPTRPYHRGRDAEPILTVKLVVSNWVVTFNNSGSFKTVVRNRFTGDTEVEFSARMIGDLNNIIGTEPVFSDALYVHAGDNADYIDLIVQCNEHTPLFLTQLEWSGAYSKRGTRL